MSHSSELVKLRRAHRNTHIFSQVSRSVGSLAFRFWLASEVGTVLWDIALNLRVSVLTLDISIRTELSC